VDIIRRIEHLGDLIVDIRTIEVHLKEIRRQGVYRLQLSHIMVQQWVPCTPSHGHPHSGKQSRIAEIVFGKYVHLLQIRDAIDRSALVQFGPIYKVLPIFQQSLKRLLDAAYTTSLTGEANE
jgi:hypothetical protein